MNQSARFVFSAEQIAAIIAFICIFLFYTYPMGLSDYWWHMNTGRWIWENGRLPEVDPFSFSYARDDDLRRRLILRAYYLGQVGFYFVYRWFGIWGLLLLKAMLLTLPLLLLWRFLLFKKVDRIIALSIVMILPLLLYRFDELRAVVFSFIGCIAVFFLLEKILDALRQGNLNWRAVALLWLCLLAWANLHRGFLIAWVIIVFFCVSESIKYYLRDGLEKSEFTRFLGICGMALVITIINPNGVSALIGNQAELAGPFVNVVDEFFSFWTYTGLYGNRTVFYAVVVQVFLAAYFVFKKGSVRDWVYPALSIGFVVQGFLTFRFSYFLILMLPALVAPYYAVESRDLRKVLSNWIWLVFLVPALLLAVLGVQRTAFSLGPWERAYFPTEAAYFLQQKHPPGNLFNAFEYGGYLAWKLYPEKIFIDQRNLDFGVYQDYQRAIRGEYPSVFKKYAINTVVFYNRQPVLNRSALLPQKILLDPEWILVFMDRTASVMVRKQSNVGLRELSKQQALLYLQSRP